MKHLAVIVFTCAFSFLACDVQENPLSSPLEYFDLGVKYFDEGSYRLAKESFQNAASLTGQRTDFVNAADLYCYLGRTDHNLGMYREALESFENAIQKCVQINDYKLQAQASSWEGDVYFEMKEYEDANEYYRRSMRLASALNDVLARSEAEIHLAASLTASGRLDEAADNSTEALATLQNGGSSSDVAEALDGMGNIYRLQGKYPEAVNTLTQAFGIVGKSGNVLLQAKLSMHMGLVRRAQSNANAAITEFRDGVNLLRRKQVGKEYEALFLFYIGSIYEENGRAGDAKKYYTDALDIVRALGDRISENYLYVFIVRCNLRLMTVEQRDQTVDKLLQSYQQIARKFQECGHRSGEAYLYSLIGSLYESQSNLPKARAMYQKAVDVDLDINGEYTSPELHLPFLNELKIARDHADWYDKLAYVLVRLGLKQDALEILELNRLKTSVMTFRHLNIAVRHPQLKEEVKSCRSKIRSIEILEMELSNYLSGKQRPVDPRKIGDLQSQIAALKKDIRENTDGVVSSQPNYETLLVPVQRKMQDMQALIPDGTLILQFLPTENELVLFGLSRDNLEVRRVAISNDSLKSLVHEYQQLLQDPAVYAGAAGVESMGPMTRFARLSTYLYDCFIRPIDSQLDRNLVIIPRIEFSGFPFHAIERQDSKGNVKYLVEITSVDYLPSLYSLRYKTVTRAPIRSVVAFGNPTGKNWSVDYELRDIRSFFKGASIMIGADASWKSFMQSRGDAVQLSTEFLIYSDEHDLGDLVVSIGKSPGESGNVPFEQLLGHEPYPVVVLSNQQEQGIGLSLEHALLLRLNGTSDVFLNAWFADRKAAKFFSEYFYTNLAAGLAPGDAYRQALLNLISTREVSHPRSWGQFFHFGTG